MQRQLKFFLWGSVLCMLVGGGLASYVEAGGPTPTFALGLRAPGGVEGRAGDPIEIEVVGSLTSGGIGTKDGAQAWTIGIAVNGWTPVGTTLSGTAGACSTDGGLRDCSGEDSSFTHTEIVDPMDNGGQNGVVSQVVLSFSNLVTLPPSGTVDIIKMTLRGTVPQPVKGEDDLECAPAICRAFYRDGLVGDGEAVPNVVSYRDVSYLPSLGSAETQVCPIIERQTAFRVDIPGGTAGPKQGNTSTWTVPIDAPGVGTLPLNGQIVLVSRLRHCLEVPTPCDRAENFHDAKNGIYGCKDEVDNDSDGKTDLDDEDCIAPQGWSLSVATDDCFNLGPNTGPLSGRGATTDGTVAALTTSGGLRDPEGNFAQTEVVMAANNNGQQGAVSAIVLSLQSPIFLPQIGESLVLILRGRIDVSGVQDPGDMTSPCLIRVLSPDEEGLVGSGEPVKTAITVGGDTEKPNTCHALVKVMARVTPPLNRFVRCDANDDRRIDIADGVWMANELFRMGLPSPCHDAADCNDDGLYTLSDVTYNIDFQFRGGSQPPAPFPGCGTDTTPDDPMGGEIACENTASACAP